MGLDAAREPEEAFERSVSAGVRTALTLIRTRFEASEDPLDRLEYHNAHHTQQVIERARRIAGAIRSADPAAISRRDFGLSTIAASFHDTVQKYRIVTEQESAYEKRVRVRSAGSNEEGSAQNAKEYMAQHREAFREGDVKIVREAILATFTEFDEERKTVVRRNLTEHSGIVARVLALADLGAAGMETGHTFLLESDALFREDNIDIREAMEHVDTIELDRKAFFRQRMLAWSDRQVAFVESRKEALESELEGLSELAKAAVRLLFTEFKSNIDGARAKTVERTSMTFEDLARDMGYEPRVRGSLA